MTDASPTGISSLFSGPDAPSESDLYKCVHCGFCLQACPTYLETGLETESPRGRIALMKAVNEGRIGLTESVVRHWDLCIQCRACEVACPSGVPYGRLIEATMTQVEAHRKTGLIPRILSDLSLKHLLPNQRRLGVLVGALRTYQRSGLQRVVRTSRLLTAVSGRLSELERSLPSIPQTTFRAAGQVMRTQHPVRARVALLSGCVMPLIHGPRMDALTRVLTRNGCEVVVPKDQVCCGALNSHVGDLATARDLARRNIDAFLDSGVETIVVASAGCGSRMKEYGHLLRDDPEYVERAERLSAMTEDVHEFLVRLPFERPSATLDYKVTYQDSCHLANAQGVTAQPRELLRSIPGVELIELPGAEICCGAGGTYTITERDFSLRLLDTKMDAVEQTAANVVATANPGCLLQLQYGASKRGLPVDVRYVVELLDEAYRLEESQDQRGD